jgi:hypothetical protein
VTSRAVGHPDPVALDVEDLAVEDTFARELFSGHLRLQTLIVKIGRHQLFSHQLSAKPLRDYCTGGKV